MLPTKVANNKETMGPETLSGLSDSGFDQLSLAEQIQHLGMEPLSDPEYPDLPVAYFLQNTQVETAEKKLTSLVDLVDVPSVERQLLPLVDVADILVTGLQEFSLLELPQIPLEDLLLPPLVGLPDLKLLVETEAEDPTLDPLRLRKKKKSGDQGTLSVQLQASLFRSKATGFDAEITRLVSELGYSAAAAFLRKQDPVYLQIIPQSIKKVLTPYMVSDESQKVVPAFDQDKDSLLSILGGLLEHHAQSLWVVTAALAVDQLAPEVRETIKPATALRTELADLLVVAPRMGAATVTAVSLAADYKPAEIQAIQTQTVTGLLQQTTLATDVVRDTATVPTIQILDKLEQKTTIVPGNKTEVTTAAGPGVDVASKIFDFTQDVHHADPVIELPPDINRDELFNVLKPRELRGILRSSLSQATDDDAVISPWPFPHREPLEDDNATERETPVPQKNTIGFDLAAWTPTEVHSDFPIPQESKGYPDATTEPRTETTKPLLDHPVQRAPAAGGSHNGPPALGARSNPRTMPDGSIDRDPDESISPNNDYVANNPGQAPTYINLEDAVSKQQADKITAPDSKIQVVVSQHGVERAVADQITASGRALVKYFVGDGGGGKWGEGSHMLGDISTAKEIIRGQIRKALSEGYSTMYIDNLSERFSTQDVADMLKVIISEQIAAGKPPQVYAENSPAYAEIAENPGKYGIPTKYFVGGVYEPSSDGDGVETAARLARALARATQEDGRARPVTLLAFNDTGYNSQSLARDLARHPELSGHAFVSEQRLDSSRSDTQSFAARGGQPGTITPTRAVPSGLSPHGDAMGSLRGVPSANGNSGGVQINTRVSDIAKPDAPGVG